MASDDTKSVLSVLTKNNDKDKKNTISANNGVSNIPPQNIDGSNNNSIKDISSSLVNNNANKGSQPSSDKPPNAPKESLVIDDLDKKNSLLKEINRIDNWANVASDNDCLIRHKTKIKIFSKISRRGLKMQEKDCMQMNYLKQIMKHPKIYIYIIKLSIASFKDGGLPMNMVDRCGFTWLDLW
jgi:hypothetical protein